MSEENKTTIAEVKQFLLHGIKMGDDHSALSYKLLCESERIELQEKRDAECHELQMSQFRNSTPGPLTAQGMAQMQAASQE